MFEWSASPHSKPSSAIKSQGSPLAGHVTEANEGVEEALVREVRGAMRAYVNQEGVAFPIEGHLVIAHS
jgi:hypothetical protein